MEGIRDISEEEIEKNRDSEKEKMRNLLSHYRIVVLVYGYRRDQKSRPSQEAAHILAFLCFAYF